MRRAGRLLVLNSYNCKAGDRSPATTKIFKLQLWIINIMMIWLVS